MTWMARSWPQRQLPFQRSPCSRAGCSSGTSSVSRPTTDSTSGGVAVGDRAAVAGQLEVGQQPAHGVELRPRAGGLVGQRQPADEAVVVEAPVVGAGGVRAGQLLAERRGRLGRRLRALLDPREDHAVARRREHLGDRYAVLDLGQPAQAGRLGLEEPLGCVRQRLHQRRLPGREPQPGRGRDVAAGDGRGRDDRRPEELLGALGRQWLTSHQAWSPAGGPSVSGRARTIASLVRSTIASTSSKPSAPP